MAKAKYQNRKLPSRKPKSSKPIDINPPNKEEFEKADKLQQEREKNSIPEPEYIEPVDVSYIPVRRGDGQLSGLLLYSEYIENNQYPYFYKDPKEAHKVQDRLNACTDPWSDWQVVNSRGYYYVGRTPNPRPNSHERYLYSKLSPLQKALTKAQKLHEDTSFPPLQDLRNELGMSKEEFEELINDMVSKGLIRPVDGLQIGSESTWRYETYDISSSKNNPTKRRYYLFSVENL
jgi:hypothetical protein